MLLQIVILALIIERVWEHAQQIIGDHRLSFRVKLIGSAAISIAAAVTLQLDLLFALDVMPDVSLGGQVLTGFVLSLGSNVIHDIIELVSGLSAKQKPVY